MKPIKIYKTKPRHPYWINNGFIEKVTSQNNSGINHYEAINLKTKKYYSLVIIGFFLYKGYKKITKEEFYAAKSQAK